MTDYFAVLGEKRRPWLDPDAVQRKFVLLSAAVHPDHLHLAPNEERAAANERFVELNEARQCLAEPRKRLRRLLELERGVPVQQLEQIPSRGAEAYFEIGQLCRSIDRFLAEKPDTTSPLIKLRIFEQTLAFREQLENFLGHLDSQRARLESQIAALNVFWESAPQIGDPARRPALPLDQLEGAYRELSYVMRWSEQIRDRLLQLTM